VWRKRASSAATGLLTKAALDYARLAWSVIPVAPRGKRPLIRWQAHQYRRADGAAISDWFRRWPDANVAVVTGLVSGLVVLDIDPQHGAEASLQRLQREHGPLPETVEAQTGGGGRHLYFAHPGDIVRNRVGIAPGIDLRGDGGYVVAPPSVHASGKPYRWVRSPAVFGEAPMPGWLVHTAQDEPRRRGHSPDHWRRLLRNGVSKGERNNTIASLAGHLLWCGVDPEVATELLVTWNAVRCRPPLDADEVARTVASIARLHQRNEGEV
jgi:hypothetical protein